MADVAYKLKKTVVMVGMMGAGKSAIGLQLSRILGVPFMDSDAEIVAAANMSIAEIFERDGEAFFREKESQVIERLLDADPCVLSTGGGAWLNDGNRRLISSRGIAVWLKADLDLLWSRVRHKDTRPLLRVKDPYSALRRIFNERKPLYEMADLTVSARPEYSIADMSGAVVEALLSRADVLERELA